MVCVGLAYSSPWNNVAIELGAFHPVRPRRIGNFVLQDQN